MKQIKIDKKLASVIIICSLVFVITVSFLGGLFDFLEYKMYDLRVNIFAESSIPSDDIIVVLLDQDSINWAQKERGWGWPWPRKAYGELIDYMRIADAHSVAFDVLFSEPSIYRNANQDMIIDEAVQILQEMESDRDLQRDESRRTRGNAYRTVVSALRELSSRADDDSFFKAAEAFGRTVQAVFFSSDSGDLIEWPAALNKPLFELSNFDSMLDKYAQLNNNSLEERTLALFPIEGLRNVAGVIGNVTGWPDSDGIIRRNNLFTYFDGKAVPGLSAASLLASGYNGKIIYNPQKQAIEWESYTIPVDKNGRSLLHYRGSLDRYFPYPVMQILQSADSYAKGETPLLPPENFSNKYIFFGFYAPGLYDIFSNPISATYPGVGIHITMLDNILQQDFIQDSPLWMDIVIIVTVIIMVSVLGLFSGRIPIVVAGTLFILFFVTMLGFGVYYAVDLWLPMVAPIAGGVLAFLTTILYNYATEGSQKRFIKSAFSQYLSITVIDQLLANPSLLALGGQRREISMFFSDIQGFTSISEKLDPSQLTELLNDYLSFMTDTILDSGGTIDKYEGDAIIAFWNAPVDSEDHAARALQASLACQRLLAERQPFFEEKYNCRLLTRIGLNTGFAAVGNFGSSKRFDFTMLGDAVNLAARLEGLNKQFGTYIMCTGYTFEKAVEYGDFYGRKLAQVAVVGKKEAVTVYEPMTKEVFDEKKDILEHFEEARTLFYEGKFAEALPLFEKLIAKDKPSSFYAEQCRYYLQNPSEWKGYWQAASK
ncbi:MAG: adenylate/guanylate cyclase domain-containing protein [Treponema sp.]|jgi:adenylate cyclase|nr:adenylate/guanylate cyclase domain-containing protein [Treponema sp.]